MVKKRVLVVDDAVVIRKILTDAISADDNLEVVGTAANGKIALQKITQCNPDIITLDVEMPEMDGLETLRNIRKSHPRLPVIMFSTLTERGAKATFEALSLGASDYVTKPANVGSVTASQQTVKDELIRRIKALTGFRPERAATTPDQTGQLGRMPTSGSIRIASPSTASRRVDIVTIGISTGGPNALAKMLPGLPADLGVPVMIVQHMPPMFTRLLAERLDAQCPLKVVEAQAGMPVEAGTVYLAPGDFHLEIASGGGSPITRLHQGPQENSCRPAVDVLFRSVVEMYGAGTLGVIMTGMGRDGFRGCELIRQHQGRVLVQDEKSSVVWGMPGFVAEAGLAQSVLPLDVIASEIVRHVRQGRSSSRVHQQIQGEQ